MKHQDKLKLLYESKQPFEVENLADGRVVIHPKRPPPELWSLDRRTILKGMAIGAIVMLAEPFPLRAATNFLWAGGGTYLAGPTTWLSTELNGLVTSTGNTLSTLGASFQNTAGYIYADVEMVFGSTASPTAGGFVELWHCRSLDNGTSYEDGSSTVAPGRGADLLIPIRAGTTITPRAGQSGMIMPPALFKPLVRNQCGATFPATTNVTRASFYTQQY